MINVNEWVADISSKAHIDIYKIKPDFMKLTYDAGN